MLYHNMKKNIKYIFVFILIIFIYHFIKLYSEENFTSNNGMGSDKSYVFNGPYNYDQGPLFEFSNSSNTGLGSDKSYEFDGPYNYDQNPLN